MTSGKEAAELIYISVDCCSTNTGTPIAGARVGRYFLKTGNFSIILELQISPSTQTLMYKVVMPPLYVLWVYFFF